MHVTLNAPMTRTRKWLILTATINFLIALIVTWGTIIETPDMLTNLLFSSSSSSSIATPSAEKNPQTNLKSRRDRFIKRKPETAKPKVETPKTEEKQKTPEAPSFWWWLIKALYIIGSIGFFLYNGIWTSWQWIHDRFFEPQQAYQSLGTQTNGVWQANEEKTEFKGHAQWGMFKVIILKLPLIPKWVKDWIKEM